MGNSPLSVVCGQLFLELVNGQLTTDNGPTNPLSDRSGAIRRPGAQT